jgi:hypothetical protein
MKMGAATHRRKPAWALVMRARLTGLLLCAWALALGLTTFTDGTTVAGARSTGTRHVASPRPIAPVTTATVKLSAAFSPLALGRRTTLEFGFSFAAPPGRVPPPLTGIELHYPNNIGLGLSGLGLATCDIPAMEAAGPGGCSPNAVMGFGEVLTGIVLGTEIVSEVAPITIMRAPDREGHLAVLFYAEGTAPVDARIIFPGLLLPSAAPFGGVVNIGVPLVETLPGAPYVSVISLSSTLGPKKVIYYEQVDGHTLAYQPRGILLPPSCPRAGFPFVARFSFSDGSKATAKTTIACPRRRRRH